MLDQCAICLQPLDGAHSFMALSNGNVNKTSNTIRVLGARVVNIAELRIQILC